MEFEVVGFWVGDVEKVWDVVGVEDFGWVEGYLVFVFVVKVSDVDEEVLIGECCFEFDVGGFGFFGKKIWVVVGEGIVKEFGEDWCFDVFVVVYLEFERWKIVWVVGNDEFFVGEFWVDFGVEEWVVVELCIGGDELVVFKEELLLYEDWVVVVIEVVDWFWFVFVFVVEVEKFIVILSDVVLVVEGVVFEVWFVGFEWKVGDVEWCWGEELLWIEFFGIGDEVVEFSFVEEVNKVWVVWEDCVDFVFEEGENVDWRIGDCVGEDVVVFEEWCRDCVVEVFGYLLCEGGVEGRVCWIVDVVVVVDFVGDLFDVLFFGFVMV